jgi:hypothetical protein
LSEFPRFPLRDALWTNGGAGSISPRILTREAYRDFGKGSSHPAKLNFGDCFAYTLAKFTGEPLLFKGDDFAHTDIRPAAAERDSAVDLRPKS